MKSGYPWRLALFSAAYYMANAAQQGYIAGYFRHQGAQGFSLTLLLAASPLAALAALPLWGILGDRAHSRSRILRIMTFLALITSVLLGLGARWGWMFFCAALFSAVFPAIQPMGDSILLEALEKDGHAFGPVRLVGCVAFALANPLFGLALEGRRIRLAPFLTASMLAVTLLCAALLPNLPGHQQGRQNRPGFLQLFSDRRMRLCLLLFMILQMTMGYFYSFFPIYFPRLPGGSVTRLGLCHFIASISEIPFLLFSRKLYRRLGPGRLLLLAALCMGGRWLILFLTDNVWAVMAAQLFHGGGFIVITVAMALYMADTAPREWLASGQMVLGMCGFGAARLAGILTGGLLSQHLGGIRPCFGAMAGLCLGAAVFFTPWLFPRQKTTKNMD